MHEARSHCASYLVPSYPKLPERNSSANDGRYLLWVDIKKTQNVINYLRSAGVVRLLGLNIESIGVLESVDVIKEDWRFLKPSSVLQANFCTFYFIQRFWDKNSDFNNETFTLQKWVFIGGSISGIAKYAKAPFLGTASTFSWWRQINIRK